MLNAYEYADLVNDARNNTYVDKNGSGKTVSVSLKNKTAFGL